MGGCLVTVSIIYVIFACVCGGGEEGLFHLRPILSINASPRNLPISSPIKSSPSRLLLPPFRSSESKTSTTTSNSRRPSLSVFWCSAVHSVHTRTHSDEPVPASVPPLSWHKRAQDSDFGRLSVSREIVPAVADLRAEKAAETPPGHGRGALGLTLSVPR